MRSPYAFSPETNRIQRFQEVLFSLNIGFAITSSLFIYDAAHHLADAPRILRECLDSFAGMIGNVASLALHQGHEVHLARNELIRESIFLGLTLGIALLLYFPVRLTAERPAATRIFASVSCITALMAVPIFWLYIVHATWSIDEPKSFGATYGYAGISELVIIAAVVYLVRNQPVWRGATVFAIHYVFWMLLMLRHLFSPFVGLPLSVVFPASGITCLLWVRSVSPRGGGQS